MRHKSIETTTKYHVDIEEEALAEELQAITGNISGNTEQKQAETPRMAGGKKSLKPLSTTA